MSTTQPIAATAVPDYNNTPTCIKHALFLHSVPAGVLFLMPLFFAILSAALTGFIRKITPGVGDKPKTTTTPAVAAATTTTGTTSNVESTTIPESANAAVDVEAGEAPPPYAPPTPAAVTTATPAPPTPEAEPTKPKPKLSSAANFVIGTALVIPLLFAIICLALSIQWLTFCQPWSPSSVAAQVFSWLFFAIPTGFATCGVSCYAILVRDLWGPKMKVRYPFKEDAMIQVIIVMTMGAVAFPFMLIGAACVGCIESAQRRWCGDALVDEGVELRVAELDAGLQSVVVGGGDGESSEAAEREEHGENVGLIQGMEK